MLRTLNGIACLGATLLAACGGGGGGGDDPAVVPNRAFAMRAGGAGSSTFTYAVASFTDRSTVSTCAFDQPTTFGTGGISAPVTVTPTGGFSSALVRYDQNGNVQWARAMHSPEYAIADSVATLADGSIAVAGYFATSVTFAPGEGNEQTVPSSGADDAFVAHYAPNGDFLWVRAFGGPGGFEQTSAVVGLPDGSIACTGLMEAATVVLGSGEPNQTTFTNGTLEGFVAKFALNGDLAWARSTTSAFYSAFYAIAGLSDGSVAVTGQYAGSTIFGFAELNQTTLASVGDTDDVMVARYSPAGTLAWARTMGGASLDTGLAVATTADDHVIVSGSFSSDMTVGAEGLNPALLVTQGLETAFLAKYDSLGTFEWARQATQTPAQFAASSYNALDTTSDGSVIAVGTYRGQAVIGEGELAETSLATTNNGDHDVLVVRYMADGTLDRAVSPAGPADVGSATGVTVLVDQTFVVNGSFDGAVTFGEGDPRETTLTAVGVQDFFLARFNASMGF